MQRHRQLQISQKELAKQTEKAQAAHQFEQFENYLELLVSLHKDWGDTWDWNGYASAAAPPAPEVSNRNELVASEALRSYSPGFFEKLFGGAKKYALSLEGDVVRGRAADQAEHEEALRQHQRELELWSQRRALAMRILSHDPSSYAEALAHASAFEEVAEFQVRARIAATEGDVVAVMCQLSDAEVVPTEEVKLSAAGKLTTKTMPATRYWSLYQDFVCSSAIRIAHETFAVLPIDRVIVNVGAVRTNPSTGHPEQPTFLAVHFARETLSKLNLDNIDPSESMKNFPHRMKFKKTTGFDAVAPISPHEQWISQ